MDKHIVRPLCRALAVGAGLYAVAAAAQVEVTDAWVRGTVAGQQSSGAFMKLTAPAGARLVAAASPVAKVVEIHEMKMQGGVMNMRAIDALDLPAGKPVTLAPGGYHVMLMGLAKPLAEGERVPLTLTVEDKSGRHDIKVDAPVRALTAPAHVHK
jgi:copper(I)-binding protein